MSFAIEPSSSGIRSLCRPPPSGVDTEISQNQRRVPTRLCRAYAASYSRARAAYTHVYIYIYLYAINEPAGPNIREITFFYIRAHRKRNFDVFVIRTPRPLGNWPVKHVRDVRIRRRVSTNFRIHSYNARCVALDRRVYTTIEAQRRAGSTRTAYTVR